MEPGFIYIVAIKIKPLYTLEEHQNYNNDFIKFSNYKKYINEK
jgi:hypothetical protein